MTQDAHVGLYLDGGWYAQPTMATPITITRGHDPDGNWPRPTKIVAELDNDDLDLDPSRPESSLYGIAGRNTRTRVMVDGGTRVYGEASQWEPEATVDHVPGQRRGRSTVRLTAEGVLRRIGKWTDLVRSPMYRTISTRSTNIGHWSLEDDRNALTLANSAGPPGAFKGSGRVSLGDDEAPLGAQQSLRLGDSTTGVSGRFKAASSTAGWQIGWSFRLAALPSSGTYDGVMRWNTTTNFYTLQVNNGSYRLRVTDTDGVLVLDSNVLFGAGAEPNQWITFRVAASQSGGNIAVEWAWYAQGMTTTFGTSDSFAGTVGRLRDWFTSGFSWMDGAYLSHVFGVTTTADNLVGGTALQVFNGYRGERAGTRFLRLCAEQGITRFVIGGSTNTPPMGPQRVDSFLNLLKEIRETDGGRIDDERFDIALTMTVREALYNQTPALTLDFAASEVAYPFRPILGDQAVANAVTAKNTQGSEVTRSLTTGPMSTQAPPAGVGRYEKTVDVNYADEITDLASRADWELAKGTLQTRRYEEVVVDLLANPHLAAAASALREGNVIQIDNAAPDAILLVVVGMVERIDGVKRTITFQTEPYDIWNIGEWDDGIARYDSRTATVNSSQTTTSTNWSVKATAANDVWSTATPYDWMVGGERVTVTAMSAATMNSSVSYTQTATVTRSVNGVVKAQTVGTEIHIFDQRRWGL